jgi:hypothetical protein
MNSDNLITGFYKIDNFCMKFEPDWHATLLQTKSGKSTRVPTLILSEIMTILICFHSSGMKTFKQYYISLLFSLKHLFPKAVSYNRFVELSRGALIPLCAFLEATKGECTGLS